MRKVLFIFGHLTDRDVERLSEIGTRERASAGTLLIKEGEMNESVFIVLDGELAVLHGPHPGRVEILSRLQAGEIVGEMSFIDASPPAATVRVEKDAQLLKIPRAALQIRLDQDPAFAARFYRAVATFLSDRLRGMLAASQPDETLLASGALESDELDPNVLDNLTRAGERFDRMLKKFRGE